MKPSNIGLKMKTLEDQIIELCEKLGVPGPVQFLSHIMSGRDPRHLSSIYEHILHLEEAYGEDNLPDEWDYQELVLRIKERYKYAPVLLSESHAAAKQILEYTHAKKKQVEHSGNVSSITANSPLTNKEIRAFKRKFDDVY